MHQINLNSDMGEGFGAHSIGNDDEIIEYIIMTNVVCGWHGGSPVVVDKVIKKATERKVAVSTRPGYPDLIRFGRRKIVLKPSEVENYIKYQMGVLMALTASYGMKLQHMAPRGTLGNLHRYDRDVPRAICEVVHEIDPSIRILYCTGAVLGNEAEKVELETLSEMFADRVYMDDLSLVPRKMSGAMIVDEDEVIRRYIKMIREGKVTSVGRKELDIKRDTLCVHGGGAEALAFVSRIRGAFETEGMQANNFTGGKSWIRTGITHTKICWLYWTRWRPGLD